ncbi:Integrase core domain-containing protein [Palleronia marisminoris]|uniref:Integrase core domain protein n=1 Tax=Palleronia marisminoris TaxID=315423 RepID=A0A1Y5TSB0_9RHOB|nr:Integrase core domain-containing protein [Palleronia marisminoris]SLN71061.1 Integrase core domain protein [Palleronia marisminoris]
MGENPYRGAVRKFAPSPPKVLHIVLPEWLVRTVKYHIKQCDSMPRSPQVADFLSASRTWPEARLWLNDGSCIRLRPERPNHVPLSADCSAIACRAVGSCDFVESRTHDRRKFRMLNVIDAFTQELRAIVRHRSEVDGECDQDRPEAELDCGDRRASTDLFILRGVPGHVRSGDGPEFIAKAVRNWIAAVRAKTAFIEPGRPWENGYRESFNSKLRPSRQIAPQSPPGQRTSCWMARSSTPSLRLAS